MSADPKSRAAPLDLERVRSAVSAYVYGNVLVLAAVLESSHHAIDTGGALLVVLVTTATTFMARVAAHDLAQRIGRTPEEHREAVREEIADATPILISGLPAALVLSLGALGTLGPALAQALAAALVLVRLAGTSWAVERRSGREASGATLWTGVALAVVGLVIAAIKISVGH